MTSDELILFRSSLIQDELNITVYELANVEPNPRLSTVYKGAEICKREGIEFLLAVGGGSVIDCTKAIAAASVYEENIWSLIKNLKKPNKALPLGTVLTHSATGTEMNPSTVITNWQSKEKLGWEGDVLYPKFSILDPSHTLTVSKENTANGIVDMMTHVLETYFNKDENLKLQTYMAESTLKTILETAPLLIQDLNNYELRETIMYSATMAMNGLLQMGTLGSWECHIIEHAISAVYDIPHGGGLAILFPNWMEYCVDEDIGKFKRLAIRVFKVSSEGKTDKEIALEGINQLRDFWCNLGAPKKLSDYNITDQKLDLIADKACYFGPFGGFKKLTKKDVMKILKNSL